MIGGILTIVLLLVNYIAKSNSGSSSSSITTTKIWIRNMIIALLLSGVYFTTLIWYIRINWHNIILQYWEYVCIYLVITSIIGIVTIQIYRNTPIYRHTIAVNVKWFIRILSTIILYNSTASPYASLTLLALVVLLYITYELFKPNKIHQIDPVLTGNDNSVPINTTTNSKKNK